jgi:hypothetical protein
MTIGIPVQANYLAWMETTKEGLLFSGHKLVQNTFLEVGPVSNEFCDNSYTHNAGDDFYRAAEDAPCYIELLPLDSVFVDYGITDEHIVYLMKLWTKLKSTNSALASR